MLASQTRVLLEQALSNRPLPGQDNAYNARPATNSSAASDDLLSQLEIERGLPMESIDLTEDALVLDSFLEEAAIPNAQQISQSPSPEINQRAQKVAPETKQRAQKMGSDSKGPFAPVRSVASAAASVATGGVQLAAAALPKKLSDAAQLAKLPQLGGSKEARERRIPASRVGRVLTFGSEWRVKKRAKNYLFLLNET